MLKFVNKIYNTFKDTYAKFYGSNLCFGNFIAQVLIFYNGITIKNKEIKYILRIFFSKKDYLF